MPIGLNFQRKHPRLGYRIKYLYYSFARRDILQKKISFGDENKDKTIYIVKPDYHLKQSIQVIYLSPTYFIVRQY